MSNYHRPPPRASERTARMPLNHNPGYHSRARPPPSRSSMHHRPPPYESYGHDAQVDPSRHSSRSSARSIHGDLNRHSSRRSSRQTRAFPSRASILTREEEQRVDEGGFGPTYVLGSNGRFKQNPPGPDVDVLHCKDFDSAIELAMAQLQSGIANAMNSNICDDDGVLIDREYFDKQAEVQAERHARAVKEAEARGPKKAHDFYAQLFAPRNANIAKRTFEKEGSDIQGPSLAAAEKSKRAKPASASTFISNPNHHASRASGSEQKTRNPVAGSSLSSKLARGPARNWSGKSATAIIDRLSQKPPGGAKRHSSDPRRLARLQQLTATGSSRNRVQSTIQMNRTSSRPLSSSTMNRVRAPLPNGNLGASTSKPRSLSVDLTLEPDEPVKVKTGMKRARPSEATVNPRAQKRRLDHIDLTVDSPKPRPKSSAPSRLLLPSIPIPRKRPKRTTND